MKVVLTLEFTLQVVQTPEAQMCAGNTTLYLSLSPSCPESGHLEAPDRVQLSFFGTDLASDTPKPRHRDAATDTVAPR